MLGAGDSAVKSEDKGLPLKQIMKNGFSAMKSVGCKKIEDKTEFWGTEPLITSTVEGSGRQQNNGHRRR